MAPQTHADFNLISTMLGRSYHQGARKVTFLGGEPTLHPNYINILKTAAEIGFQRIIVDTNGLSRYPVSKVLGFLDRLAIRFSFEGARPETHNVIRGKGAFGKTLNTLRNVVAEGIRAEVTCTINAVNVSELPQMVSRFTDEGISELNFHFMSLMGNGKSNPELGLTPGAMIYAQEQLEKLKHSSVIPLRYPKLLVRKEELDKEIVKGCHCRIFRPETLLIFPNGEMRRCPLEITPGLAQHAVPEITPFRGCPLSWRLLPKGIPKGYVMTCISWKGH